MPIKKLQKLRFQDGLVIAFGFTLFLITIGIMYVLAFPPAELKQGGQTNPDSQESPTPVFSPNVSPGTENDQIHYDQASVSTLLDKLKNPIPLSDTDISAKARMIAVIPKDQETGMLYQTNNMYISYIRPADKIYVVIKTKEISQAKAEANIWFRSKGFSQKAICDQPVMFYPSQEVKNFLRGSNVIFSLSPNGC